MKEILHSGYHSLLHLCSMPLINFYKNIKKHPIIHFIRGNYALGSAPLLFPCQAIAF